MKLEIKKKLLSRSDRVKSVDLHTTLPWVLIALYAGNVVIFDYNSQS
jgi:coatomer subunit beta'